MIIITLKKGVIGIERISTDEEIILKDYDIQELPNDLRESLQLEPSLSDIKKDDDGFYVETEL